ncbi:MAG: N-acetylglucosamine-6-phosphate deacetylase [Deltaproteobacteria bacterium]|nr:N-acetylglucosamine-6-phosphate deacetylase [Deltaproteobacteria bacterium]MBW2418649.1 N-acetylglucosamine-6-phosphate deacetylase [Deltaproteobacteria bacterium]
MADRDKGLAVCRLPPGAPGGVTGPSYSGGAWRREQRSYRLRVMERIAFRNALLLDPEASSPAPGGLVVEGGRIMDTLAPGQRIEDAREVDLAGRALSPGFLDLHFHGELVFAGPGELHDMLRRTAAAQLRHGVTGFLATTMAWGPERLARHLDEIASFMTQSNRVNDAALLGVHLEGPWINPAAAGAQPAEATRSFSASDEKELLPRTDGLVKMVTLAPELPGSERLLDALARRSVVAALGHSLADRASIDAGIASGMTHVTHLFNAMGPMHQREPGVAGHALADDRLSCDVICDGEHVHPAMLKLAARAKGDRLILITDRIELPGAAGQRAGSEAAVSAASFGSGAVLDDGRALRLADGRLAGSSLTLDRALRNARSFGVMNRLEAVAASTLRPARVLGIESERGTLRRGARADLVVLDESDRVQETWLGGERVFARESRD